LQTVRPPRVGNAEGNSVTETRSAIRPPVGEAVEDPRRVRGRPDAQPPRALAAAAARNVSTGSASHVRQRVPTRCGKVLTRLPWRDKNRHSPRAAAAERNEERSCGEGGLRHSPPSWWEPRIAPHSSNRGGRGRMPLRGATEPDPAPAAAAPAGAGSGSMRRIEAPAGAVFFWPHRPHARLVA
jgi:hypothetical protein